MEEIKNNNNDWTEKGDAELTLKLSIAFFSTVG